MQTQNKAFEEIYDLFAIRIILDSDIEIRDMKQSLFDWGNNEKISLSLIMQTLRLAIIGQLSGPDLFEICALIGKDVSLKRVQKFKTFCLK